MTPGMAGWHHTHPVDDNTAKEDIQVAAGNCLRGFERRWLERERDARDETFFTVHDPCNILQPRSRDVQCNFTSQSR